MTAGTKPPGREEVNKKNQVDRRIKWQITLIPLPLVSTPPPPSTLSHTTGDPWARMHLCWGDKALWGPLIVPPSTALFVIPTDENGGWSGSQLKNAQDSHKGAKKKSDCFLTWEILVLIEWSDWVNTWTIEGFVPKNVHLILILFDVMMAFKYALCSGHVCFGHECHYECTKLHFGTWVGIILIHIWEAGTSEFSSLIRILAD